MATLETLQGLNELKPYIESVARQFQKLPFGEFGKLELLELADFHAGLFADANDPSGVAWPPLAPSTVARKGHDTILVETGRLRASLTQKSTANSGDATREVAELAGETDVIFGTTVEYSPYHDTASGNRPARPHVGINEQFLDGFCDRLIRYAINELAATA